MMQRMMFAMIPRTPSMIKKMMRPRLNSGQFHGGTGDGVGVGDTELVAAGDIDLVAVGLLELVALAGFVRLLVGDGLSDSVGGGVGVAGGDITGVVEATSDAVLVAGGELEGLVSVAG
jgi:hypothetical protein